MKAILIGVFFFFSSVCYSSDIKIIHVSDGATLNGKQAVSVYFGESQKNFCTATIPEHLITSGYKYISKQRNNRDVDIDCNWNGKYFTPSSKHKTFSSLKINTIDKNKKLATIIISLNLVNHKNNEFFKLENIKLHVKSKIFNSLVKHYKEAKNDKLGNIDNIVADVTSDYLLQFRKLFAGYKKYKASNDSRGFILFRHKEWSPYYSKRRSYHSSVLEANRKELSQKGFVPVLYSFDSLALISLELMRSLRDNDPKAEKLAKKMMKEDLVIYKSLLKNPTIKKLVDQHIKNKTGN